MDSAITKLVDGILEYGPPGLVIAGLLLGLGFLWREFRACDKARTEDGKIITKVASENTSALTALKEAINANERKREDLLTIMIEQAQELKLLRTAIDHATDMGRQRYEQLQRDLERRKD